MLCTTARNVQNYSSVLGNTKDKGNIMYVREMEELPKVYY
jgi:hypothetical protein